MTVWMTLIVEENHGYWSAWFKNTPDARRDGKSAEEAMTSLLLSVGADQFDTSSLRVIDDGTRNRHLEFSIRFIGCGELPTPSVN